MAGQDRQERQEPRPPVAPRRRAYDAARFERKSIDSAKRTELIRILVFSVAGGAIGALAGALVGIGAVPGFLVGFLVVFGLTRLLVTGAGRVASTIHSPSGESTPPHREYSYPQSLAARGAFVEAIAAYQVCVAEDPDDPEPYLRIARLYRDELRQYDDAVAWFKRARANAQGAELLATREIIDIYVHKLRTATKAIPELVRLRAKVAGTPAAESAQRELEELRRTLAREPEDRDR